MSLAVLVFVVTLFGIMATVARTMRMPCFAGRGDYLAMLGSAMWWLITAAFDAMSSLPSEKIFYSKLAWYGIVTTPVFWMLFTATYIRGHDSPRSTSARLVTVAFGLMALALAMTNDWHHGIYVSVTPDPVPDYPYRLAYSHGLIYNLLAAVIYVAMLVTTTRLAVAALSASSLHRRQFVGLLLSALLPWIANASYNFGNLRLLGFDPTPIAFVTLPLAYHFLIAREKLFALAPVAFNVVFNSHPDSMLVVNASGVVVEANPAAMRLLEGFGNPVGRSFGDIESGFRCVEGANGTGGDLHARDGRTFEMRWTPILSEGQDRGRIYVFRDVTAFVNVTGKLTEAAHLMEERLDANIRLQDQLREMTLRDSLTGMYNRRILDDVAAGVLGPAARDERTVSFALIDVDHFKTINDTYGHKAGDEVLVEVARVFTQALSPDELAVRMGGEEFLIVLPGTPLNEASRRIEAWRSELKTHHISGGAPAPVCFSAGLMASDPRVHTLEQVLQLVDRALYEAKNGGRDRTVIVGDEVGARAMQDRLALAIG